MHDIIAFENMNDSELFYCLEKAIHEYKESFIAEVLIVRISPDFGYEIISKMIWIVSYFTLLGLFIFFSIDEILEKLEKYSYQNNFHY